jgi:hypothetical protein
MSSCDDRGNSPTVAQGGIELARDLANAVKESRYFWGIDVLRFLAAFRVLIFHLGYLNNAPSFEPVWPETWLSPYTSDLLLTVPFFVPPAKPGGTDTRG